MRYFSFHSICIVEQSNSPTVTISNCNSFEVVMEIGLYLRPIYLFLGKRLMIYSRDLRPTFQCFLSASFPSYKNLLHLKLAVNASENVII